VDEIMRDENQAVYGKRRRRKRKNDLKRGSQHLEMRWAPQVEDSPKNKMGEALRLLPSWLLRPVLGQECYFFLATAFLAAGFLAGAFAAGAFLTGAFLAGAFLATGFLATAFLAAGLAAAAFLATGFLATGFLAAGFLAAGFFATGI
jgi:hypothetical protein